MGAELGRISGPLLSADLLRHGVDLAFETDLLYLSVTDLDNLSKSVGIGVNTDTPSRSLTVVGLTSTTDLLVDNTATIANFYINTNRIQSLLDPIIISPNQTTNPQVITTQVGTANLRIRSNVVENITLDSDINLAANGLGKVTFTTSRVDVNGNLHAAGDITLDGDIIFGSDDEDNVTFNSDIASNIVPDQTITYNLGSNTKRWDDVYVNTLDLNSLEAPGITVNNINLLLTQGNTYYVSVNGADTNVGDHLHNTFRTVKHALSVAAVGDEIVIFPGTYVEEFPLTVPQGVTVKGAGIRSVTIKPTAATVTNDCFLLNGETTVGFLTVQGFNSPGYAFKLAPGYSASIKSPYIYNVSVITSSSSLPGSSADIYSDPLGLAGSYTSNSVAVDQINYTQSLVESWIGKLLMTWNGEGFPVTFYEIVDVIDEPLDPGFVWRIVLERDLEDPGEGIYQFSIYPNEGLTSIVGTSGYTAATDYSRSFVKTSLPLLFNTTVTEFWTCQIGEGLNIVESVEEDPANSALWRVNFKDQATNTNGLPIFTSPSLGVELTGGSGALIDGSVASSSSAIIPTMLFYSTTFIVPNARGIVATNRARVEWLNSFTYFAETGIRLETGTSGIAGEGKTRVTLLGATGNIGDTFTYLSDDDQTVIATGVVSAINNNEYTLDGFVGNLVTIDELQPVEFISINNALLSTSEFKFGTSSLLLTGTNYISGADSFKYNLADNNFCIECWVYPTEFPIGDATIIGQWGATDSEQSFNIQLTITGGIRILLNDSQDTVLETGIEFLLSEDDQIITDELGNPVISENSAIRLDVWQHIAVVRQGTNFTLYVNGLEKASTTLVTGTTVANAQGDITIGNSTPSSAYFIGYVDEVRISTGVSRFVSEFVPPTIAYTSDTNTALLLHFDGLNNSQYFVDDSDLLQNIVFTNANSITVAKAITALDYRDFAAEMRSINSANVYGTYGAVADGRDTLAYLVGHNFGYIGSGTNSDNDPGLVIQANEVVENNYGTIYYDSVDHKGDYRVGDIFYVNQETGQVTFDAQALDFSASGNIVLEGPTSTTIINAQYIQTGNLRIYNNNIDSLAGSVNFSAFNNSLTLNTNLSVTGNLEIIDNLVVAGNIFLGNDPLDTIAIISNITQSILPNIDNLNIGSDTNRWDILYSENIAGTLQISNAEISILTNNTDLQLIADGIGSVVIKSDLEVTENITTNGYLEILGQSSFRTLGIDGLTSITGNIDQSSGSLDLTGNLSSANLEITGDSYFYAPDIKIYNNVISVESTDENLIITANGAGSVIFDNALKISNSVISNVIAGAGSDLDKSIIFQPNGTGNLEIDSSNSLVIPAGSAVNRAMVSNGEIRFNTQYNSYEGFSNTGAVSFNNITDLDRTTIITSEATIGADTDTITFTIDSVVKSFVDPTKLFSNNIIVDTISLTNNTISSSSDLEFINSNTGSTVINGIEVKDDSITNIEDTALIISSTPNSANAGYVKFGGNAVVFPHGTTLDRRSNPELAELRYNSTLGYMEIYSGTTWIPAVGTEGPAGADEIEDILNIYALIIG
jgi:hypothetical protein